MRISPVGQDHSDVKIAVALISHVMIHPKKYVYGFHFLCFSLIEAEWRKYASPTYAIIGSDNGSSPGRRQPIIWTNAGILLIEPRGRNVSEILIEICTFSFKKIHFKISSGKWRPFCLGLNVLNWLHTHVHALLGRVPSIGLMDLLYTLFIPAEYSWLYSD